MVGGSSAYLIANNDVDTIIPTGYPVEINDKNLAYNIDYKYVGAPFVVRESGVYVFFFICSTEQACQFTIFVNGIAQDLTTTGNNAGASQIIMRNMLVLKEDDVVIVRNYESASNALQLYTYAGGSQVGNNSTFLTMKIAPLPCEDNKKALCKWNKDCLSRRKRYLFKKLLEKMLLDPDLMLKGFNVHGTFYNTNSQVIPTEQDAVYDQNSNVNGLGWSSSNPSQVTILEDGVYKLFFNITTNTAAQFAFTVNGVPIESTTQGTNKGAGQLTSRTLLELKKDDVVTVRNHTSANSNIITSANAGGVYPSMSVILTVFKIAPLVKTIMPPCQLNKNHSKCFEQFKCYLLLNKHLQLEGSDAYISSCAGNHQIILPSGTFDYSINIVKEGVYHKQGESEIIVKKDGIYDVFADINTNEPSQITLFVNGTPEMSTVSGRDSGGNRCIMRQFVKLNKGDVVTLRNYESHSVSLSTSVNSGGHRIGHPVLFMMFLLSPNECEIPVPPPVLPTNPPDVPAPVPVPLPETVPVPEPTA